MICMDYVAQCSTLHKSEQNLDGLFPIKTSIQLTGQSILMFS